MAHGVLREKQPHPRFRRHSSRAARGRGCLQEPVRSAGRRRAFWHREPAYPAAVRFRRSQDQLLGRGIAAATSLKSGSRRARCCSATGPRHRFGEIGGLISASYSDLTSQDRHVHIDKYYARTDLVPGQTVYATGGIGWRQLTSTATARVHRLHCNGVRRARRSKPICSISIPTRPSSKTKTPCGTCRAAGSMAPDLTYRRRQSDRRHAQ